MARKPMVTRTIQTTNAKVLCLNVETQKPEEVAVVLPRTYKDERALMKKVHAVIDTEVIKAVHVIESAVVLTKYGMTEEDFISAAEKIEE